MVDAAGADLHRITPFKWTAARETAVGLVADDKQSDEEIAAAVGVSRKTLHNWRQHPEFAAKVAELVDAAKEAARALTIANKEVRVRRLAERADLLDRVIAARAEEHADVPGGDTGLLVREPKIVKVYDVNKPQRRRGPSSFADEDEDEREGLGGEDDERLTPTGGVVIVYEYRVDTGTLAELRNIEKQAAQELGEWTEKKEVTGKDGGPLLKAYIGIELDEV